MISHAKNNIRGHLAGEEAEAVAGHQPEHGVPDPELYIILYYIILYYIILYIACKETIFLAAEPSAGHQRSTRC